MTSREAERRAQRMLESLVNNDELNRLELEGFVRGFKKGKTMHVPFHVVASSLKKQWQDWQKVRLSSNPQKMKRALADLRNVAGCAFLKLQEIDADLKARRPKQ